MWVVGGWVRWLGVCGCRVQPGSMPACLGHACARVNEWVGYKHGRSICQRVHRTRRRRPPSSEQRDTERLDQGQTNGCGPGTHPAPPRFTLTVRLAAACCMAPLQPSKTTATARAVRTALADAPLRPAPAACAPALFTYREPYRGWKQFPPPTNP